MILKLKRKYVKTAFDLEIHEVAKHYIQNIYTECLLAWNLDRNDVVSFFGVESVVVGNADVKKLGSEPLYHALLKFFAAQWLRKREQKDVVFEYSYPSGRADVACPESKIAVECGNVGDHGKVARAVQAGWTLCLMPYQMLGNFDGRDKFDHLHYITIFSSHGVKLASLFKFMTDEEVEEMQENDSKLIDNYFKRNYRKIDFNKISFNDDRTAEEMEAFSRR